MKTFEEFLVEKNMSYSYGCMMLELDTSDNDQLAIAVPFIQALQANIKQEDLYIDVKEPERYGLEEELHCTLLYGLLDSVTKEDLDNIVEKFSPINIEIKGISIFENADKGYDVVKLELLSKDLSKYNKTLKELPYKNDYPDYNPHITLAYVKLGKGKDYVQEFTTSIKIKGITKLVYKHADRTKKPIHYKLDA